MAGLPNENLRFDLASVLICVLHVYKKLHDLLKINMWQFVQLSHHWFGHDTQTMTVHMHAMFRVLDVSDFGNNLIFYFYYSIDIWNQRK